MYGIIIEASLAFASHSKDSHNLWLPGYSNIPSLMAKDEDIKMLKTQTWVLKVFIHCEGCKKKVKKVLQSIDGVYTTTVDAAEQKVTVTGNVDSETLIKKLLKTGKHAELWPQGGQQKAGNQQQQKPPKEAKEEKKDKKEQKPAKGGDSSEDESPVKEGKGKGSMESGGGGGKKGKGGGGGGGGAVEGPSKGGGGEGKNNGGGKKGGGGNESGGGGGAKKGGGKKSGGGEGVGSTSPGNYDGEEGSYMAVGSSSHIGGSDWVNSTVTNAYMYRPHSPVVNTYAETAEYATDLFSDENTNSCSVM
eukprot:Gb_16258 [translate_table: standard]